MSVGGKCVGWEPCGEAGRPRPFLVSFWRGCKMVNIRLEGG